jgi:xanthine/CO dehydrogenase XdhC/CoxF family maturation factor
MLDILDDIDRWRAEGQRVALATVIKTVGSTPRPLGSKMAVSEQGAIAGSVSGGCIEGAVYEEAQAVLRDGTPRRVSFGISDEQAWSVGLSCGGTVEVLVEALDERLEE